MKLSFPKFAAGALVIAATVALAQEPAQDIDPGRHGNLAAAQNLVRDAYDRLSAAQYANHSQLGGHAARAKELLREANDELELAAITANER